MALSLRTLSIIASVLVSLLLIVGAFLVSGPNGGLLSANAGASDELLKEYAKKDTDADGLPDWQEALYKTDPMNAHSVSAALTDKQAVEEGVVKPAFTSSAAQAEVSTDVPGIDAGPTTLTDRFARQFFERYLSTRGDTAPTVAEMNAFILDAISDLKAEDVRAAAYTEGNTVRSTASGSAALRTYAGAAAQAFVRNAVTNDKDDLSYFTDALLKDDASALAKIRAISAAYKNTARDLMLIPVPLEISAAHVEVANSLVRMSHATEHLASYSTDPLRGYLGLAEYDDVSEGMVRALATMHDLFDAQGVTFTQSDAGFLYGEILIQAAGIPL